MNRRLGDWVEEEEGEPVCLEEQGGDGKNPKKDEGETRQSDETGARKMSVKTESKECNPVFPAQIRHGQFLIPRLTFHPSPAQRSIYS